MKYIDYVQLNPFQKLAYNLKNFFIALPGNIKKFFCALGRLIKNFFLGIGKGIGNYCSRFVKGDWATKLSYIIMGVGNAAHGQIVKGLIFLAVEVGYILYMVGFGWHYLSKFGTLGTEVQHREIINGARVSVPGDNSMLILLYGVLTIIITVLFFIIYIANTKSAYKAYQAKAAGEHLPTFKEEMKDMLDN